MREDHVLDEELPLWVPIPALAEMQIAIEQSVSEVTGLGERMWRRCGYQHAYERQFPRLLRVRRERPRSPRRREG